MLYIYCRTHCNRKVLYQIKHIHQNEKTAECGQNIENIKIIERIEAL